MTEEQLEEFKGKVASHIAAGGWSSLYALIEDLDENYLLDKYYFLNTDKVSCPYCGEMFSEDDLDEKGLCSECSEAEKEKKGEN